MNSRAVTPPSLSINLETFDIASAPPIMSFMTSSSIPDPTHPISTPAKVRAKVRAGRCTQEDSKDSMPPRLSPSSRRSPKNTSTGLPTRRFLSKTKRQGADAGPKADGYPACDNVGNEELSCFPERNTTLTQDVWSKFIWNANYPSFIGAGAVDAYLFTADSMEIAANWTNQSNAEGMLSMRPNDHWWRMQDSASNLSPGRNATYSYYFVVVPVSQTLSGGESHQSTFLAVQTALPTSVQKALSSASSASVASARLTATAAPSGSSTTRTTSSSLSSTESSVATGNLQPSGDGGSLTLPTWAIVTISISGALLLGLLLCLCCWGSRLRARRRRSGTKQKEEERQKRGERSILSIKETHPETAETADRPGHDATFAISGSTGDHLHSNHQQTPSEATHESSAPLLAIARSRSSAAADIPPYRLVSGSAIGRSPISDSHHTHGGDGASLRSDTTSLSAVEAATAAEAFRQAMRQPDFQSPLEEGSTPGSNDHRTIQQVTPPLERELRSQGVGVKEVGDRRSIEVQGGS